MLTININYAFNGFLYAPIFVADALGFFPKNTRLVYRQGDAETIDALCGDSSDDEKNWFAICDPFSVNISDKTPEHRDEICVVGTLIDKLPVWVYNSSANTSPVPKEEELAKFANDIRELVCYRERTTGYLLGKRLQGIFKLKDNAVTAVEFGAEFGSAVSDDTVVVSSDALRIVHAGLNEKKILFNYPQRSPDEIKPFLFTAILTLRKEVVEANLWVVLAVLAGIKNAIELLKRSDPDSIQALFMKFQAELTALGYADEASKKSHVGKTVKYLADTMGIYSDDLRPQKQAWNNAKVQWEKLLNVELPGIEERNEPIPALLVKRDWKKDAELRAYITAGIPNIGSLVSTSVLSLWHKAAIPVLILIALASVYAVAHALMSSTADFRDNFPAILWAFGALLAQIYGTIALTKDVLRYKLDRFGIYFGVVIVGALGAIIGAVGLIK